MAKTIAVSNEVYDLLAKSKLPHESFSDVIRRSLRRGMRLSDIAGSRTVSGEEWERVDEAFRRQRKLDEDRRRGLLGRSGARV